MVCDLVRQRNTLKYISLLVFVLVGLAIAKPAHSQEEHLQDIRVTITFNQVPTNPQVEKAWFKYNKDFALVLQMDQDGADIYNKVFPYFTGKEGNPGLFYTDGAGHDVPFKMGISHSSVYNGTDVHQQEGGIYLSWNEIGLLWNEHFCLENEGYTQPTIEYLPSYEVLRNASYTKKMTAALTRGGIDMNTYVLPSKGGNQLLPAKEAGYISFYDENGQDLPNPVNVTTITPLIQRTFKRFRIDANLFQNVRNMADNSTQNNHWLGAFFAARFGVSPDISFDQFKNQMDQIATTYGKDGSDNIWVASSREVNEYLVLRDKIVVQETPLGNTLQLRFSGTDIPTNFRYNNLSLLVTADAEITDIKIIGATGSTAAHHGDTALINLSWKGQVIEADEVDASKYIDLVKAHPDDQYTSLIAADYVDAIQNPDSLKKYKEALCDLNTPALELYCSYHFTVDPDTICLGDTATLVAPDGMKHYLWSTGDTTQSIRVAPKFNQLYWAEVVTSKDKTGRDTTRVIVNPIPVFDHSPDTLITQPGYDTLLWVSSGYQYRWSTGSTDTSIQIKPYRSNAYSVKVSSDNGCSVRQQFLVVPDYHYSTQYLYDTVCFGDTSVLINVSSSTDSLLSVQWDLDMNGKFNDASGDTVRYVFPQPGIHLVGLRLNYYSGAIKIKIHQVPVGDIPKVNFSFSGVCSPNTSTNFADSTLVKVGTIESRIWSYGDGKTESRPNIYAYHNYHPGDYEVKLVVTSSFGCVDSLIRPISIYNNPNVSLRREDNTQVYFNDTVKFIKGDSAYLKVDNPTVFDSVVWPGNHYGADFYLKETGLFRVTAYNNVCPGYTEFIGAYVNGSNSGSGDTTGTVVVTPAQLMPVFTPNGDGYNDKFVVDSPDITQPVQLSIYNRAGSLIFEDSHYNNDWKGEYRGNLLPKGTYFYLIKDATGKMFSGTISILR
jgi:gliding motility-associated-like protein